MHLGRALLTWGAVFAAGMSTAWCADPPAAAEWQVLEPTGEGFRVELPGKPESQIGELDTKAGKIRVHTFLLIDERRGRTFQAATSRLPAATNDVEALLNRTRDGAVRSVQGKLVDERRLPHEQHPGRALTIVDGGGRHFFLRLYAAADRLYQLTVVSDAAQPTAEDQRVLSSFQIVDGAAPPAAVKVDWRFITPRNEKLALEMPADPQESSAVLDTPLGRVKLNRLECSAADRTYFVQVCDWPAPLGGDAAVRLDVARDHALQSAGGKLTGETPLTVNGRAGRTLIIAAGPRTLHLRTVLEGPRVYQWGTYGYGEMSADEKRFLESLKLPALETK